MNDQKVSFQLAVVELSSRNENPITTPRPNASLRSGPPQKVYPPDSAKANDGWASPLTLLPQLSKPSAAPRPRRPRAASPPEGGGGGGAPSGSVVPGGEPPQDRAGDGGGNGAAQAS